MPLCFGQEIERALHAGQHAERQAIDLHELQRVDVVLVPFDDLAVRHRRRFDRHQFVEPVMGQHEAARMLRQMPRRADQFAGQRDGELEPPVLQVEVELLGVLRLDAFLRPAPDLRRQHLDEVFGQAERLADVAQRALGPVADHGRARAPHGRGRRSRTPTASRSRGARARSRRRCRAARGAPRRRSARTAGRCAPDRSR